MNNTQRVLALLLSICCGSAGAQFTGYYDTANWTIDNTDGGSSIVLGASSVELTSSNLGGEIAGDLSWIDFTITAPQTGLVTFDWAYTTSDLDASFDPFGYLIGGTFTQLSTVFAGVNQGGSASFAVNQGQMFGFRQIADDSCCGPAKTIISNFSAPLPVPEPLTTALLLAGLGVVGALTRRRRTDLAA